MGKPNNEQIRVAAENAATLAVAANAVTNAIGKLTIIDEFVSDSDLEQIHAALTALHRMSRKMNNIASGRYKP